MRCSSLRAKAVFTLIALAIIRPAAGEEPSATTLLPRNLEAPFCYRPGAERSWQIATGPIIDSQSFTLTARREATVLATGRELAIDRLTVRISDDGRLHIASDAPDDTAAFELHIRISTTEGAGEEQTLTVRPAPPDRPLSYIADFGDDLISIYRGSGQHWRPIEKSGLDQYFRRLQAQGISRLIVWLTPFPYITSSDDFEPDDWRRYEAQARAILDSPELTAGIEAQTGFSSWGWLRQLMALRLMPEFGQMLSDSATEHGIRLTVSFRPFEPALTKYYVVPAFDESGAHLWDFQPLCAPSVNYHLEDVCFAHYREILRRIGRGDAATLTAVELPGLTNASELVARFNAGHRDFELRASRFPPLAAESLVLVRDAGAAFQLRPYGEIRAATLDRQHRLTEHRMTADGDRLRIEDLRLPVGHHFLWISQKPEASIDVALSTAQPVLLRSAAGTPLGGENVWFALDEIDDSPQPTRVSGIPPNGQYHAEFQATEASIEHFLGGSPRTPLDGKALVVNLGPDWSIEMLDFTQPAARECALRQLRTVLACPAFDEIFINTRSHTQLAGYLGDDLDRVQPIAALRREGVRDYRPLGRDEAYAPRNAAEDPVLRELASRADTITRITQLQPGEWREHNCHRPGRFPWRYARNRLVAQGVRQLLLDLEREFPETRIRAVIPPHADAVERVMVALDELPKPDGSLYGREYYRHIWASLNHIPNIGDGMALVDLTGTGVEPVLHGIRFAPADGPLSLFVDACINDLSAARGSSFRGPMSFFYEAQETLRSSDPDISRRREEIICKLLARPEINEVILYEAADWTYKLPWTDPDRCGHGFLDRCGPP